VYPKTESCRVLVVRMSDSGCEGEKNDVERMTRCVKRRIHRLPPVLVAMNADVHDMHV
jgi:hypothetical protein